MSTIIYEADNIVITSSKGKFISDVEIPTIRLNICVLINGKLKNVFQEWELIEVKGLEGEENGYDLKDYNSLNTLGDIFTDLGYKIEGLYGVVRTGISKL